VQKRVIDGEEAEADTRRIMKARGPGGEENKYALE